MIAAVCALDFPISIPYKPTTHTEKKKQAWYARSPSPLLLIIYIGLIEFVWKKIPNKEILLEGICMLF